MHVPTHRSCPRAPSTPRGVLWSLCLVLLGVVAAARAEAVCNNGAGTVAVAPLCEPVACPFPARCPGQGATCIAGTTGEACTLCARRWARHRDTCKPCPAGFPVFLLLFCLGLVLVVLIVGPTLARLASPTIAAQLRGLILYLQFLALALDLRLHWPPLTTNFFAALRGLTNGADMASPECYTDWSYTKHVYLILLGAAGVLVFVAALNEAFRLRQRSIVLRDSCSHAETARRVERLEGLMRRRNALRQFFSIYFQIVYILVSSVILAAWDCVPAAGTGGVVLVLRSDPDTMCADPAFLRFRAGATAGLCVFALVVPLGVLLLLRWVRCAALQDSPLRRPAWRGWADPATRAAHGGWFQMYRYSGWHSTPCADGDAPAPISRAAAARAALQRSSNALSPYFECTQYVQRMLLLLAGHTFKSTIGQASVQGGVLLCWAVLIACTTPLQRLDVRVPLLLWSPFRLGESSSEERRSVTDAWRAAPLCGWLWSSHIMVFDALNSTAVAINLVPLINLVLVAALRGRGSSVVGFFLLCLNALTILLTLAIWLAAVAAWRLQAAELDTLKAARRSIVHVNPLHAPQLPLPTDEELPLAPAETPLRRRSRAGRRSEPGSDGRESSPVATPLRAPPRLSLQQVLVAPREAGEEEAINEAIEEALLAAPDWLVELEQQEQAQLQALERPVSAPSPSPRSPRARLSFRAQMLPRGAALLEEGQAADEAPPTDEQAAAPGCWGTAVPQTAVEDARSALIAGGAKMALLRARGRHTHAVALARNCEFVATLVLVRLQHRRDGAKRAGEGGRGQLARIETDVCEIERLFLDCGFEAAMQRDGVEHAEREHRASVTPGVPASWALAFLLALVAALSFVAGTYTPVSEPT